MLKDDGKYRELKFVPVLSGGLSCIHRPSRGGLYILKDHSCTAVVTLLSPTENPHEIGNVCHQLGMKWLWVPLQGANKKLLESNKVAVLLKEALINAKQLLQEGEFILVHCAAGIHRTGTFLYALLRICGLNKEETMDTIWRIRVATYEKCGQARFDLAEGIANDIIHERNAEIGGILKGFEKVERISQGFFWVKVVLSNDLSIKFECVVTNFEMSQYVKGPTVNLLIKAKELVKKLGEGWCSEREFKYFPKENGVFVRRFEQELMFFLKDVCEEGQGRLIGQNVAFEKLFISTFFPKVDQYLHTDFVNIEVLNESISENVYDAIVLYKESLNIS